MFLRNLLVLIEINACDTKVHIVEETPMYSVNMDFKISIKGLGKANPRFLKNYYPFTLQFFIIVLHR